MMRTLIRLTRLFENFWYYRKQGARMHEAWSLAKMTLP